MSKKIQYKFKKGAQEIKPVFVGEVFSPNKEKIWDVSQVSWFLKWVFYNEAKEITKADWTKATIPPSYTVQLINWEDTLYVGFSETYVSVLKGLILSLLSVELGEEIVLSTYISKWYKVVSVTNPQEKVKITSNWKELEVNKSYPWAIDYKTLPEAIEIKHPKTWEVIERDYSDLLDFLRSKIKDKFNPSVSTSIDWVDVPF